MQKTICLLLIIFIILSTNELKGDQEKQNTTQSSFELPIDLNILFSKVMIYHQEGGILTGLLVGVEDKALKIRRGGKDIKIPANNLAKVIIETEKKTSHHTLQGALLGTYLANLIFLRAENHPTAYMRDPGSIFGIFLTNTIFVGAGGGLGYLLSLIRQKREKVFDFKGNQEKKYAEWERLRRFVIGSTQGPKKVHISIQAGHVFTQVSNRYFNLLKNNDYYVSRYICTSSGCGEASDFNLLRKLQFTVSLSSNIETGFALIWSGEPSLRASTWETGSSSRVSQSLSTTGYYGIGIYKPFHKHMPKQTAWNVGVGVGAAKFDFSLNTHSESWYPYNEKSKDHIISKTLFSGVIFTELNIYLYRSLSVGLSADYVFVPSKYAPEIPEAEIPAQKLRHGNGCIGFSIGLHL